MKGEFIIYDATSCGTKNSLTPTVHFGKSGLISFSRGALNLIGLQPGDKIKFFQSKKSPKEWYLAKVENEGFTLRKAYDKKSKTLMLNNAFTVKSIMNALNLSKGTNVKIGSEPDEDGWWSLITSGVK
jgi:hypothetical protein